MQSYRPLFGTMTGCWRSAYPKLTANIASVVIPCLPHGNRQVPTHLCNPLLGLPLDLRKTSIQPIRGQTSTGHRQEYIHMPPSPANHPRKLNMGIMTSAARSRQTVSIRRHHSEQIAGRLRPLPGLFSTQRRQLTDQPKSLPQRGVRLLKPSLAELLS